MKKTVALKAAAAALELLSAASSQASYPSSTTSSCCGNHMTQPGHVSDGSAGITSRRTKAESLGKPNAGKKSRPKKRRERAFKNPAAMLMKNKHPSLHLQRKGKRKFSQSVRPCSYIPGICSIEDCQILRANTWENDNSVVKCNESKHKSKSVQNPECYS